MSEEKINQLEQQLALLTSEVAELRLSRAQRLRRSLARNHRLIRAFLLCFVMVPVAVSAFTTPNAFTAGTPAVAADVNANFAAIKTRFDDMENKSWRLVHESDITVATAAVNVTGLSGNTDRTYRIVARFVNATGATVNYYVQPNGDGGMNYGQQYIDGSGSGTAAKGNPGANSTTGMHTCTATAGTNCETQGTLYAVSGYARVLYVTEIYNVSPGAVGGLQMIGNSWNNTAANITSLNIMSPTANAIGVGSHIEVWARR